MLFRKDLRMHVVVEIMLGMLMGVTGTFRTAGAAGEWAAEQNSKLKRGSDTYYQVWPLKEKNRVPKKHPKKPGT